jgi:hypothetical protein
MLGWTLARVEAAAVAETMLLQHNWGKPSDPDIPNVFCVKPRVRLPVRSSRTK